MVRHGPLKPDDAALSGELRQDRLFEPGRLPQDIVMPSKPPLHLPARREPGEGKIHDPPFALQHPLQQRLQILLPLRDRDRHVQVCPGRLRHRRKTVGTTARRLQVSVQKRHRRQGTGVADRVDTRTKPAQDLAALVLTLGARRRANEYIDHRTIFRMPRQQSQGLAIGGGRRSAFQQGIRALDRRISRRYGSDFPDFLHR